MSRAVTLALTVLSMVVLAFGSVITVQLLYTVGEGGGFGYALTWPLTWFLYGLLTAAALWTAGRLADGVPWLGSLLALDLLWWFFGLPILILIAGKLPMPKLNLGLEWAGTAATMTFTRAGRRPETAGDTIHCERS